MDALLVRLRKKPRAEGGNRRRANPGDVALGYAKVYAADAGVVSRSLEKLRKMMSVIVVVYLAFTLTVSDAETEIMCKRTTGMPEAPAIFSEETAGQVYNKTNEFVCLGGNVNQNADRSIDVERRIPNAWYDFWKYTLELYDQTSAPLELKPRC